MPGFQVPKALIVLSLLSVPAAAQLALGLDSQTVTGATASGEVVLWSAGKVLQERPSSLAPRGSVLVEEWQTQLLAPTLASPVIAQVDGVGPKEIIVTTYCPFAACPGNPYAEGRIFILTASGTHLPGWPRSSAGAPFSGGAVAGDIDNDGDLEVVAGSWSQAFVWNHDGSSYPGWPKPVGTGGSPALADLDAKGDLEIVYASLDGALFVWNHDGTSLPGWPYVWTGGTGFFVSPAVADIDRDGLLEIAAGTGQGGFTTAPFEFFTWERDGSVRSGFPITTTLQNVAPALGDLDADGAVELTFSDGRFLGQDHLYVVDANGNVKPGWPVVLAEVSDSAPALGDLDGDGDRDVVVGGAELDGPNCIRPRLYAHDSGGSSLPGFPIDLPFSGGFCPVVSPPVVVDIDGDGDLEVVVKYLDTITAYHGDGSLVAGFPFGLSDDGSSSSQAPGPAFDDVDGDGQLEFVFASVSGRIAYFESTAPAGRARLIWPMYKHDRLGTSDLGLVGLFSDGFESGDTSGWSTVVP